MNNIEYDDNIFKDSGKEHWKEIEGFPDYQVSDQGRVKSLKFGRERILKLRTTGYGYLDIKLWSEGKYERKLIHRLVIEAFLENPDNKPECNHKNGIKTDNRLENLEWVTHSENMSHAYRTGLATNKGETHPRSKLTESDVLEILEDSNAGIPLEEVAGKYNISKQGVCNIKAGRSWSHVTGITQKNVQLKKPAKTQPISLKAAIEITSEAI